MQSKKFHLVPLLFLACTFQALSQSVSIGVSGGPALTDLRFENDFTNALFDPAVGFRAGGNLTWRFSKFLGLRTGLDFERKGGRSDLVFSDENGLPIAEVTRREMFDFVAIPVMLEASFGNKVRGIVQVGQSVGILVQHTASFKNLPPINGDDKFHRTDQFNRLEHAIIGGLGMETDISGNLAFQFLIRPTYGLSNINDSDISFGALELQTFSLAATVGLQLFLR